MRLVISEASDLSDFSDPIEAHVRLLADLGFPRQVVESVRKAMAGGLFDFQPSQAAVDEAEEAAGPVAVADER